MRTFRFFMIIAVSAGASMTGCEANYSSCSDFNALPHTDVMKSIGDSYIALASSDCTNITVYLGDMMGLHYNDYSVSADKIDDIIGEYNDHVRGVAGNPVTTLLMDGGGNDTLQGCNDNELPLCERTINYVLDRSVGWIPSVYADGIEDIVWFGYPRINCGGDYEKYSGAVDYGMDIMMTQFTALGVHMVDIRTVFADGVVGGVTNCAYIGSDGVHPSAAGSFVIAQEIYDTMAADMVPPVGAGGRSIIDTSNPPAAPSSDGGSGCFIGSLTFYEIVKEYK
ncbi:MAG: SGNH/GDSL hydrolase family protein [Deltaproteobacteria bacterium]|nr:SGNH/GDSL hydrolase family protein [Deltaproteobacteria bacterium]